MHTFSKVKKDAKFFEVINNSAIDVIKGLSEKFNDIKIAPDELEKEVPKLMKKYMNAGGLLVASAIMVLGLGIGAIGDSIANYYVKKNADKKVQSQK